MFSITRKANLPTIAISAAILSAMAFLFLGTSPALALNAVYKSAHLDAIMPVGALSSMGHVVAYAALTLIIARKVDNDRDWFIIAAALFALGCGVEVAQEIVGGRSFELADIIANTCGIALAMVSLAAMREINDLPSRCLRRRFA